MSLSDVVAIRKLNTWSINLLQEISQQLTIIYFYFCMFLSQYKLGRSLAIHKEIVRIFKLCISRSETAIGINSKFHIKFRIRCNI